jgi:predicted O-linked N-acetylglucosamine transferase (SPINDLY family)
MERERVGMTSVAELVNKAISLHRAGNLGDAEIIYKSVLQTQADHFDALHMLGVINAQRGQYIEAEKLLRAALAIDPRAPQCHHNFGTVLANLRRFQEAAGVFDAAIMLAPTNALLYSDRGHALLEIGRFEEAIADFGRVLSLDPNFLTAQGDHLHAKMQLCDWSNFDAECARLISSIRNGTPSAAPFQLLVIPSTPDDQLRCARQFVASRPMPLERAGWQGERHQHDKIHVAYVFLDVRLVAELFEQHDRSRFKIIGISLREDGNLVARQRLIDAFDEFHDVRNNSDSEVAALLRDLEIDIAVDLKGHTWGGRYEIFASHPAPVQVSYLGYPSTMGLKFIDYIIADEIVAPFEHQPFFLEKIVHLPHCYQVNDSKRTIAETTPTRAAMGLPERGFVFCCFNNNFKITPGVFGRWMRILKSVENSVLWLLSDHAKTVSNLQKEAVSRGVIADRLVFAGRMPQADHLARHRLADLFLDTLPYNAHTTSSDALWAGLPVLTCLENTFAGRVSASLLNTIGLPEMIAPTLDAYEVMATDLATHPEKLAIIKSKLADNRLSTPLFNTKLFTKDMEAAYTAMYERHLAGAPPDCMTIPK